MAKRSRVVPEAARPERRAHNTVRRSGGVCAHSGRLPYFQLQVHNYHCEVNVFISVLISNEILRILFQN